MPTKPKPTSTAGDVLRLFWQSLREHKGLLILVLASFSSAAILQLINPLQYRRFFDLLTSNANADRISATSSLIQIIFMILAVNVTVWLIFRTAMFAANYLESVVMAKLQHRAFEYMIDHSYSFLVIILRVL